MHQITIVYTNPYSSLFQQSKYHIIITDILDANGSFTESESTYNVEEFINDVSQGTTISNLSAINQLISSTEWTVSVSGTNSLRNLSNAVTLTRRAGSIAEFVTTYDITTCSYDNKTVSVNILTNGTTIDIGVTSGYTFKIAGTTYANGSHYPAS